MYQGVTWITPLPVFVEKTLYHGIIVNLSTVVRVVCILIKRDSTRLLGNKSRLPSKPSIPHSDPVSPVVSSFLDFVCVLVTHSESMPHSTSGELSPVPNQEDILLPDAPANDLDLESGDGESNDPGDPSIPPPNTINDAAKIDVKLEDLFNDDDEEDDEFPSSGPSSGTIPSSPPAAPV